MNESTRTLSYVGAAAVSVVLAAFFAPSNPKPPNEFAEVGQPFFADFPATDATSLSVVSFSDILREKVFNVELNKAGKWVIGSHRNYPADGKDRLAKTASSLVGIKKEQFKTKDPEQYAELQVIDPLDKDSTKLKGRGQRVTLKDASGKLLADYIIGKRVPDRDSFYYVRNPAEKSVYMAKVEVDLSTKFADWIESDLLQLQGENLAEVVINKYTIDKKKRRLVNQETNILKRPKPADPWTLDGLDAAKEEVNQDEVKTMATALADLKILGVRQKPEGLSADLKTDKGIAIDAEVQDDLASKGFYFTPDGQMLSNEGEMIPITDGGVAYNLRFGEVFTGTELEMETGLEADPRKKDAKDAKQPKSEVTGTNKSRYVFITAHFDAVALGPKPEDPAKAAAKKPAAKTPVAGEPPGDVKPGEPKPGTEKPAEEKPDAAKPAEEKPGTEKPAGEKPTEEKPVPEKPAAQPEETPKTDDCQDEPAKKAEEPAAEAKPEVKPEAAETKKAKPEPAQPAAAKPPAPVAGPQGPTPEDQAKADLLAATKKYQDDLKAYNDKIEKGQKKAKELNARFADWYYVISEENFLKLRLSRTSLVKEKTKPEAKPGETIPGDLNPLELKPGAKPAVQPEAKPAAGDDKPKADPAQPEAEKPAAKPAEKPADPKPEEPKADEPKAEEKKADEPKADEKKPAE